MTSLTTVYFLSILLVSIAGMGSVFIANKVNPHSREDEAVPTASPPTPTPSPEPAPLPEVPSIPNPAPLPELPSLPEVPKASQKPVQQSVSELEKELSLPLSEDSEESQELVSLPVSEKPTESEQLVSVPQPTESEQLVSVPEAEQSEQLVSVPEAEQSEEPGEPGRCKVENPELYDFIQKNYNSLSVKNDSELIKDFGLKFSSNNKVITKFSSKHILELLRDCHPDKNIGDKNTENIAKILNKLKKINPLETGGLKRRIRSRKARAHF